MLVKYKVGSLEEFIVVRFVNRVYIYPKALYTIPRSLLSAKPDLLIASLLLTVTTYQVFECNLLGIQPHVCECIVYRRKSLSKSSVRLNYCAPEDALYD